MGDSFTRSLSNTACNCRSDLCADRATAARFCLLPAEQDSPFTVVVTCSGTYTDDVDVKLTVSGSTDSTCPNTEFLEVTVEKPGFTLTPPGEVCVTGDEFEAEFTLEDEVALGAYNTWAEDGNSFVVTPLKNAAGDEATDVECEGGSCSSLRNCCLAQQACGSAPELIL